jgi:hypothetical protein
MLALGLNSRSSFDGIDAVLVDIAIGGDGLLKRLRFIAGKTIAWPQKIADQVLASFENKLSIFELCRLNYVAGALYWDRRPSDIVSSRWARFAAWPYLSSCVIAEEDSCGG